MSLITTTAPEHAEGQIAQLYQRLQGRMDYLPNYAGVFAHRPALMALISDLQNALRSRLESRLYALVTLAAARQINSSYCALAFAGRLINNHFTEEELIGILSDPENSAATDRERAAMALARAVAEDASQVGPAEIRRMRQCCFSDTEIFDVVAVAAWRCFFAKIPDGLGARPDRALAHFSPRLLKLLVVGRAPEGLAETAGRMASKNPHGSPRPVQKPITHLKMRTEGIRNEAYL